MVETIKTIQMPEYKFSYVAKTKKLIEVSSKHFSFNRSIAIEYNIHHPLDI